MNRSLQTWRNLVAALARKRRFWVAILLFGAAGCAAPGAAWAQQCSSSGWGVPFGTVSTSADTDVTSALPYACQSNASDTYYNVCLFIPGGTGAIAGIAPKLMQDYNGHYINYNLYSDSARTQIIGPPPAGGSYPLYTWNFVVPGGWSAPSRTVNVYGRVPRIPAGTAAGNYQAQFSGITLQYAWSNTATPTSCSGGFAGTGGTGSAGVGFNGATATVSSGCSIAIGAATNMDFGSAPSITAPVVSTSTITLNCPANTSWKVGLGNGLNSQSGQRRMAGPSLSYLNYDLYTDPNHTRRWGNDTAGGTNTVNGSGASQANPTVLTVYGLVLAQPVGTPGTYTDTVTITLAY